MNFLKALSLSFLIGAPLFCANYSPRSVKGENKIVFVEIIEDDFLEEQLLDGLLLKAYENKQALEADTRFRKNRKELMLMTSFFGGALLSAVAIKNLFGF